MKEIIRFYGEPQTISEIKRSKGVSRGYSSVEDIALLKNALVELGHAVGKGDLNISSRRHIEMFWDLVRKV